MLPPSWNENHNTGIPVIDWQHKTLLSAIESLGFDIVPEIGPLEETLPRQRTIEQIQDIKDNFDFIYVYWAEHVRLEELFMRLYNYPELEYALHKVQHKELFRQALLLRETLDEAPIFKISAILKELLVNHILQEDMRYVNYIKGKMSLPCRK